jgi:hypothetical protein
MGLMSWITPGEHIIAMLFVNSMRISLVNLYRYVADSDKYDSLDDEGDWIWEAKPLAKSWKPARVAYYTNKGKCGDFISLTGPVPVFGERAWEVLRPLIGESVEALPLICDRKIVAPRYGDIKKVPAGPFGPFCAIHVLKVVDCLDRKKSGISEDEDTVYFVPKYVFRPHRWKGEAIFKLPETQGLEVLVSDEFKNVVKENNLKGLEFVKLGVV